MRVVLGILLIVAGAGYPIFAVYRLNRRLGRQPALTPRQLALTLAFNGILPVSLVFWGLGLMAPGLWAVLAIRMIAVITALTALLLLGLLRSARTQPTPPHTSGNEEHSNGR